MHTRAVLSSRQQHRTRKCGPTPLIQARLQCSHRPDTCTLFLFRQLSIVHTSGRHYASTLHKCISRVCAYKSHHLLWSAFSAGTCKSLLVQQPWFDCGQSPRCVPWKIARPPLRVQMLAGTCPNAVQQMQARASNVIGKDTCGWVAASCAAIRQWLQ